MNQYQMQSRIETLAEKKLVGMKTQMSFARNKTAELWQSFMPRLREIHHRVGMELYSLEVYNDHFFNSFDAANEFEKWAAVEVEKFEPLPGGMQPLIVPQGLYAVFTFKGLQSEGARAYEFIGKTWLPSSNYLLDRRPHFAVMAEKYKMNDPSSEEEIWIPVQSK